MNEEAFVMRILEYGNPNDPVILLIHGFESPYQVWDDYVAHFQGNYHILLPILPGHDPGEKSEFLSFEATAKEIEDFCISKSIDRVHAVYGMSMGGVLASILWKNGRLSFEKILLESSPLLPFGDLAAKVMTRQYIAITRKARQRDKKVLQSAVQSMVTEDKLDAFLELLDNISDTTIENYLQAVGRFRLPADLPDAQLVYFYGGKLSEVFFRNVARFLRKHYQNVTTVCLKGKGHCEDALLHPKERIRQLELYIR